MSFSLDDFIHLRPYCYHLTSAKNLDSIKQSRALYSASKLKDNNQISGSGSIPRPKAQVVDFGGTEVELRDQATLSEGHIKLEHGWTFAQVVQSINERVFFWPGRELAGKDKAIDYGQRFFDFYALEKPVILKISTKALFEINAESGKEPQFCKFNSGAPRYSGGKPSPRGPETFLEASQFKYLRSKVREVTFRDFALLPENTQIKQGISARYKNLF